MSEKEYKDGIYPTSKLRIAVTGKGGVGKTVISALMTRILTGGGRKVLLVDADPAMGLSYILGADTSKSIGNYRDRIITEPELKRELGTMQIKDVLIREALVELKGSKLLIMGKEESTECYCGVNSVLKYGIGSIAKDYDIMLIDCEAGLEQIHRRVLDSVDTLFIITDMSARGIKTATQIKEVVESRKAIKNCKRLGLMINRQKGRDVDFIKKAGETNLEIFGSIPEDENVSRLDLEGLPISALPETSPSLMAVRNILDSFDFV
ncbi:MAG: AAA family ATPase [Desulfobacteraceae bacterium]|nr:AAA family ATPase [Desulfobacteraceae bacterium]